MKLCSTALVSALLVSPCAMGATEGALATSSPALEFSRVRIGISPWPPVPAEDRLSPYLEEKPSRDHGLTYYFLDNAHLLHIDLDLGNENSVPLILAEDSEPATWSNLVNLEVLRDGVRLQPGAVGFDLVEQTLFRTTFQSGGVALVAPALELRTVREGVERWLPPAYSYDSEFVSEHPIAETPKSLLPHEWLRFRLSVRGAEDMPLSLASTN